MMLTAPGASAVTTPVLVTDATEGSVDVHRALPSSAGSVGWPSVLVPTRESWWGCCETVTDKESGRSARVARVSGWGSCTEAR